ncbi:MAG: HAD family hydrolase [Planctomycetota bacterium]|nr:HAD family hydrolase [Planctomycetota bacterium]
MTVRLLAIDLDGTLLGPDGVSDHDLAAISAAREAGIEIVVATGRSWLESGEALDRLGRVGVMIGAGGALLHDARTGATIARCTVEPEVVLAVTESLRRHGHVVHLLQDAEAAGFDYWMIGWDRLHEASRWWFDRHGVTARWVGDVSRVLDLSHTVRVGTTADGDHLGEVAQELREDLGDRVVLQAWPAVVSDDTASRGRTIHLLEAFDPEVDKWTMLQRVARDRGIPPEEIAAIGDGLNDIGMVGEAGVGVAMAGADPRVRSVARWETGPPGVGVGDAIRRMLAEA